MADWQHKVKIKHLFTEKETHKEVQKSMNEVADVLDKNFCFARFDKAQFRIIPKGDKFFSPADYANKLLDRLYDFADENRIWID